MSEKEFKVIETQEELDKVMSKRINEINNKHSEATAELQKEIEALKGENASLKSSVESGATKYTEFEKQIADLQGENAKLKLKETRDRVGFESGIPYELFSTIQGGTEEEMKAHAQTLSKYLAKPKSSAPEASSEPSASSEGDSKAAFREMLAKIKN